KKNGDISNSDAYVGRLPASWKELPSNVSDSYWYGFIVGLIAADGHCDKRGCVSLCNKDLNVLTTIQERCESAGFIAGNIMMTRKLSPYDGTEKPVFRLNFPRMTVSPDDLLIKMHRDRFVSNPVDNYAKFDKVVSVKDTGQFETVYCGIEESAHSLVVNGVLSRNCHTAGWTDNIADHYAFTFDELMKGGGVGANYSNRYINKYNAVRHEVELHIVCDPAHADYEKMKPFLSSTYHHEWAGCIAVEDSREGWVDCLVKLLRAAWQNSAPLVLDM